jgi:hypothetical protein
MISGLYYLSMIKRSLSLLLITALCVAVIPDANALTAKAGAKCTKVKATSVVKGKKYTCIKSGKKLIWNKGVVVKPAAKPSTKPSPAVTPIAIGDPIGAIGGSIPALNCPTPAAADIEGISQIRADALLGMSENQAEECANSLEWIFRVGQRDDEMFAMTRDYRMNRVTVIVMLGVVTRVDVG